MVHLYPHRFIFAVPLSCLWLQGTSKIKECSNVQCMFSCKRNIRSQGNIEKRRTKAKFCLIKLKYGTKKNEQSCNKKEGGLKYREEVNVSEKQSG